MKSQFSSVIISSFATVLIIFNLSSQKARPDPGFQQPSVPLVSPEDYVASLSTISKSETDNLQDVRNKSLGFQEVHVISLPQRRDKQDSFVLQAAYSGIEYSFVDGVDGRKVPDKALPHTMKQDDATIGCWRAHLNIYQDIIKRNVASVMILEDDADWDVALKSQLIQFARGSRYLCDTESSEIAIPTSPYGDDWDILWLGHNGVSDKSPFIRGEQDNRRFVIPEDPTVLPPENRTETPGPDMSYWESGPNGDTSTRIVLVSTWSINLAGYAVSQRGARKLLALMSLLPNNDPVDVAIARYCKFKIRGMKCIAPFPAIIGVSKPAGGTERWSDMNHIDDGQTAFVDINHGFSLRVRFSVRQNIDRLLDDQKVFRDADGTEMHIDDIGSAVGHSELLQLHEMIEAKDEEVDRPTR